MAFTGVPACLLAELPKGSPHIEGFGEFVASFAAPIATGWSDPCRAGIAPAENRRLFTAHVKEPIRRARGARAEQTLLHPRFYRRGGQIPSDELHHPPHHWT